MTTVALEQAQQTLPLLIDIVSRGDHVLITRNQVPVAELVPVPPPVPQPTFGSARGLIKMAEDFDAPLNP